MDEQKEPELTLDLLTKHTESPYDLEIYNYCFSNKAIPFSIALQRLQTIANTEPERSNACVNFVSSLMEWAPQTQPPLTIVRPPKGYFFYNGDVHTYAVTGKSDMRVNGRLKVDRRINLKGNYSVQAKEIEAQTVDVRGHAWLDAFNVFKAQRINAYSSAHVYTKKMEVEVVNVYNYAKVWAHEELKADALNTRDVADIQAWRIDTQILNACGQSSVWALKTLSASTIKIKDKAEVCEFLTDISPQQFHSPPTNQQNITSAS